MSSNSWECLQTSNPSSFFQLRTVLPRCFHKQRSPRFGSHAVLTKWCFSSNSLQAMFSKFCSPSSVLKEVFSKQFLKYLSKRYSPRNALQEKFPCVLSKRWFSEKHHPRNVFPLNFLIFFQNIVHQVKFSSPNPETFTSKQCYSSDILQEMFSKLFSEILVLCAPNDALQEVLSKWRSPRTVLQATFHRQCVPHAVLHAVLWKQCCSSSALKAASNSAALAPQPSVVLLVPHSVPQHHKCPELHAVSFDSNSQQCCSPKRNHYSVQHFRAVFHNVHPAVSRVVPQERSCSVPQALPCSFLHAVSCRVFHVKSCTSMSCSVTRTVFCSFPSVIVQFSKKSPPNSPLQKIVLKL